MIRRVRCLLQGAVVSITVGFFSGTASTRVQAQDAPHATTNGKLRIFFVDVEGGQATLFVSPSGESLLIDAGWPGNDRRDANRIVAAAKEAGLKKIDYLLITHYHDDHVGGVPQLVAQIPVGTFIDHGPNRELDHGVTEHGYAEYQRVLATTGAHHIVARPGDRLPIHGLDVMVVSADGNLISESVKGGGQANLFCKDSETRPADETENGRSLGVLFTFGKLKILDLGDLTWDKERELMCPANKLGPIDIDVVSHHGWYQSNSPALIDAINPRVAIMDNGAKKGGSIPTLKTIASAPGLERLWELHFSEEGGTQFNTAEKYIANPHGEGGHSLEVSADHDGSFEVRNSRTGFTERYPAR
jgi:competence protein ComEC